MAPTWLIWRRMAMWRIASFQDALEAEQERRHAIALLNGGYGRRWKRHATPELDQEALDTLAHVLSKPLYTEAA
jgi:hypothetical protein